MTWFKKFLLFITGENRFVTVPQIHETFFSEEIEFIPSPDGGWPNRERHVRFLNDNVSIFYHYCDSEYGSNVGKEHEDIDIRVKWKKGGLWATWYGYKLEVLTLNAQRLPPSFFNLEQRNLLSEIVLHLRKICREQKIEMPQVR